MSQFLKKAGFLAFAAGAALAPNFAQAADPCVVATVIDSSESRSSNSVTKRLVDYKSNQVIILTSVTAGSYNGGNATALSSKSFLELDLDTRKRLEKSRPAVCPQ